MAGWPWIDIKNMRFPAQVHGPNDNQCATPEGGESTDAGDPGSIPGA